MSGPVDEREIDFGGTPGVPRGNGEQPAQETKMLEIIDKITDPEFTDLEAINRLIALEIALTLSDPNLKFTPRAIADKVKALRELTRTLQEGDNLSKKDFLNFDGPKFKYVLRELVVLFKSSLKSSGLSEDVINHILRIFRGEMTARELDLRKETERITHDSLFTDLNEPQGS